MKKAFFAVIAGLLAYGLQLDAAPVSPSRALEIGKKILAAQPSTKARSGAVRIVWDGESYDAATKSSTLSPAFYVVARDGGGFVIIAGDDNVTPVLAISDRNEFRVEGMPDNARWWMDHLKSYVRSSSFQTPEVRARWEKYAGTKAGDGSIPEGISNKVEKLTPEWGQGGSIDLYSYGREVFNAKCPTVGGSLTLTGCAATALAEVMAWQSGHAGAAMPVAGQGTVGGYVVTAGVAAPVYELGTVYMWDQLRTLTGTEAIKQAIADGKEELLDNVAQLLADLGASMHSRYGVGSTSSYSQDIPDYVPVHFGYNKGVHQEHADQYSTHRWAEKMKDELNRWPVLIGGYTESNSGHIFVADGYGSYDGTDYFHFNIGWCGLCNGYYLLDHPVLDFFGYPYDFSKSVSAFFDLYPAPESVYPQQLSLKPPGLAYLVEDNGIFKPVPPLGAGGTEYSIIGWIKNTGRVTCSGKTRQALKDKAGRVKVAEEMFDFELEPDICWLGWPIWVDDLFRPYAFGDYLEFEFATYDAPTQWRSLDLVDGAPSETISTLPVYPAAFIQTASSYKLNDWFEFALKNHTNVYHGTVWTFTDPDGITITRKQTDYDFQFKKMGLWKIEAAVAPSPGDPVTETIVAYVNVK